MRLLKVLSAVVLLTAAAAAAQDVRSDKYPRPGGEPSKILPRPPEPKTWEVTAGLSMASDANISHLLVNSAVNSNAKVKDNIRHAYAGFAVDPAFARRDGLELGYSYDNYAYRAHKAFSYYDHSLYGVMMPRLGGAWRLDLGGSFDLVGDKTGVIAQDGAGRAGLVWSGPAGLRIKGGYERGRDKVKVDPLKDADTSGIYLLASRRFLRKHLAFFSLRARSYPAAGPDYAYKSRSAILGLISRWSPRFKLIAAAALVKKDYDNVDSRFLKKRSDATASLLVKPVVVLARGLSAEGSFMYLDNSSNVSLKRYTDTIYSVGLEGRF